MGEVYKAEDLQLGRTVAIKVLPEEVASDRERLARFEREARAVAALNHPNIVTLYTVEQAEGVCFYAMELVEGQTLDEILSTDGMELDAFYEVAVPLADALAAAHERGVIHRDLKPTNVMVGNEGRVKVLDFGLAKLAEDPGLEEGEEGVTGTLTRSGALLGTVPYMSPEQAVGERIDERSDLFSLGVILHEMLTGRRPFRGSGPAEVLGAILRDAPAPVEEVRAGLPLRLVDLVDRCLAKKPEGRPRAAQARDELSELAREHTLREPRAPSSIAVLPFADISRRKDQDYFCQGMAEEIIGRLAKIEGLHVASRTASFQFREAADVAAIGRRLRVETILEGSVRKAGNRIRVTAQLIKVADGYRLWSESYDRELEDLFAIQDEIAESVARALRVILTPRERQAVQRRPAESIEAYELYLRGRMLFHQWGQKHFEDAREMFERAAEVDPGFALAYAGVADSCSYLYMHFDTKPENLECAEEASRKALELAP